MPNMVSHVNHVQYIMINQISTLTHLRFEVCKKTECREFFKGEEDTFSFNQELRPYSLLLLNGMVKKTARQNIVAEQQTNKLLSALS